jgi:hypothetical protein
MSPRKRGVAGKGSIESGFEIVSNAFSLSRLMVQSKVSLEGKICIYGRSWLSMKSGSSAAAVVFADPNFFRSFGTIEEAIAGLCKIRGVGEWTAQYVALRALRETDAFPAADIALLCAQR